jgi:hypothetical protein
VSPWDSLPPKEATSGGPTFAGAGAAKFPPEMGFGLHTPTDDAVPVEDSWPRAALAQIRRHLRARWVPDELRAFLKFYPNERGTRPGDFYAEYRVGDTYSFAIRGEVGRYTAVYAEVPPFESREQFLRTLDDLLLPLLSVQGDGPDGPLRLASQGCRVYGTTMQRFVAATGANQRTVHVIRANFAEVAPWHGGWQPQGDTLVSGLE